MNLELKRDWCGETCTEGQLYDGKDFLAYTLEDVVRGAGEKIKGDTAIPAGRYQVVITHSPRFKRDLPLLLKVPNFEGIRIHPGNTANDTEGCILVGRKRIPGAVQESRLAFEPLFKRIQDAIENMEGCWITITE